MQPKKDKRLDQKSKANSLITNQISKDIQSFEYAEQIIENHHKMIADGISVYFNQKPAIRNISMKFKTKTITAIIGPSGCGKTVFLRSLNRMHSLTKDVKMEGKVFLDNVDIYSNEADPIQHIRKIGMVFQKPNPFPTMSIYDNVVAGWKLNGFRNKKILDEIAEEALRMAYLWDEVKDNLKKPATELSGGQQQRLCIARAIATKPEILLMDEPTASLDPISTQKVEEMITQLKKNLTIIIITHNMQQAKRVSDYSAFMYLGKLIEFGDTNKIFSNPNSELTDTYVSGKFG